MTTVTVPTVARTMNAMSQKTRGIGRQCPLHGYVNPAATA